MEINKSSPGRNDQGSFLMLLRGKCGAEISKNGLILPFCELSQKCKKWLKMAVYCVKLIESVQVDIIHIEKFTCAYLSQKLKGAWQMEGKILVDKLDPVKLCLLFCLHFFGHMKVNFSCDIRIGVTKSAAYGFQRITCLS